MCQPGSIRKRTPTRNASPGFTWVASTSSAASTRGSPSSGAPVPTAEEGSSADATAATSSMPIPPTQPSLLDC